MTYLTENPWPLIIFFSASAVVAFLTGSAKSRGIASLCLLLAVGVFFLERALISPGEEVERELEQMLTSFIAEDIDAIGSQIASQKTELRDIAEQGLEMVDLGDGFHIRSVNVRVNDDGSEAIAEVRANGMVLLRQGGTQHHVPTFWKTTWRMDSEDWKLFEVVRLDVGSGKEIGILSAQQ